MAFEKHGNGKILNTGKFESNQPPVEAKEVVAGLKWDEKKEEKEEEKKDASN